MTREAVRSLEKFACEFCKADGGKESETRVREIRNARKRDERVRSCSDGAATPPSYFVAGGGRGGNCLKIGHQRRMAQTRERKRERRGANRRPSRALGRSVHGRSLRRANRHRRHRRNIVSGGGARRGAGPPRSAPSPVAIADRRRSARSPPARPMHGGHPRQRTEYASPHGASCRGKKDIIVPSCHSPTPNF